MIDLTDSDVEFLERFAAALPAGWRPGVDKKSSRTFYIYRIGPNFGTSVGIVLHRTIDKYLVTVCDDAETLGVGDSGDTQSEIFECATIGDAVCEVRLLICEFMQTEDPSAWTPYSWANCLICNCPTASGCSAWIPSTVREDS